MKKVHIDPLSDRVVVMPEDAEEKTASGIILPDTAQEKPHMGKIVAAGPGKVSDNGSVVKMSLQTGDKVLYGKYSGTEITLDGNEVLIMRESDILATFKSNGISNNTSTPKLLRISYLFLLDIRE